MACPLAGAVRFGPLYEWTLSTHDRELVRARDEVVVGRVLEPEREHALLLEVGLVDTSKRADEDSAATEETGLKSGVLTRRTLSVVLKLVLVGRYHIRLLTSSPTTTQGMPLSR